jgi:hypothetical protein
VNPARVVDIERLFITAQLDTVGAANIIDDTNRRAARGT